ncbi:hypothetical protein [Mycobacteroides abscessus]|uniref:hypothetical protein n=1 Tax=Mycobacteroides abscessus TaxID=36809 RepID=UPI000943CDC1|nr:hypothetical protein [Mycobacteroides abscessus]
MTERPKRENWKDSPPKNWAEREAYRLSRVILDLREGRSMQWLSDRTDELGHRVSRSVLSDLETGRRRYLTTVELTMIAAAFNTAPVVLLYPGPYDEPVDLLPSGTTTQFKAAQWFSANSINRFDKGDAWSKLDSFTWMRSTNTLHLWRDLNRAEMMRMSLLQQNTVDREQIAFYDSQIHRLRQELGIADV